MVKRLLPLALIFLAVAGARAADPKIPIVHSTDLFHPHGDPDDHFDLATLFALEEFDIRGIILDDHRPGASQSAQCGRPPVEQMIHVTGRKVPWAIGLAGKMKTREDNRLDAPDASQEGVRLLLSVLRRSKEKVVLSLVGSMTDAAVAFNREPELLREKVRAVYVQAGNGPRGPQPEYNVALDPIAYVRVLESGLPIYWCPCYGVDNYQTFYRLKDQSIVISACTPPVQNFFVYCFAKSKEEPIGFLVSGKHPLPGGLRQMWCTAPMFHAVGRNIYQRGEDDFVALSPKDATQAGLANKLVEPYRFLPIQLDTRKFPVLDMQATSSPTTMQVFRITDSRYEKIMASCLKNLLASLGR